MLSMAHSSSYEYDSFDQFSTIDVRHRFPAQAELFPTEAIAVFQRRGRNRLLRIQNGAHSRAFGRSA
jgi:hypothetical protein